jgi:cyclohexanone monooxygenase
VTEAIGRLATPVDDTSAPPVAVDAVIVGSGWAGMYMLYRLRQLGLSAKVIEAGGGVGGTWYWNRYPGARCDVPSLNYCYSFNSTIWSSWDWSERYAAQPEIEAYANYVADHLDLRKDIRLNTRVLKATYRDDDCTWLVETDHGSNIVARYCIFATGSYSAPIVPDIPGIDTFRGELYYSARWPSKEVDFRGKRIGVIGTGSSGVQIITAIGRQNEFRQLTVFQRTPNFAIPARNAPLTVEYQRDFKRDYPAFWARARESSSGTVAETLVGPVGGLSDEEFQERLDASWVVGGPAVLHGISDLYFSPRANERMAEYCRTKVRARVKDEKTAELLCPRGYYLGSRRLLNEDGYFETYNLSNVRLVDLCSTPIERVQANAIQSTAETFPLDMLICATGFDSVTGAILGIDTTGSAGVTLREKWAKGPLTYLGIMVNGFPNLFLVAGPASPSIRSNVLMSIEQHVEWIADLIDHAETASLTRIEASDQAEAAWTEYVAETADRTLLTRDDTQYIGANVAGKPRVYLAYVGGVGLYRQILGSVRRNGYEGIMMRKDPPMGYPLGEPHWSGPPPEVRGPASQRGNPVL